MLQETRTKYSKRGSGSTFGGSGAGVAVAVAAAASISVVTTTLRCSSSGSWKEDDGKDSNCVVAEAAVLGSIGEKACVVGG